MVDEENYSPAGPGKRPAEGNEILIALGPLPGLFVESLRGSGLPPHTGPLPPWGEGITGPAASGPIGQRAGPHFPAPP